MWDRPGERGWCLVLAIEKGFDQGENRISLFFVESPDFFSWVSRFSFTRGWQVCMPYPNDNLKFGCLVREILLCSLTVWKDE